MKNCNNRVAILGGGLAGLTAGLHLFELGVPFQILEARSRVGGRIFTTELSSACSRIDIGARFIGEHHVYVRDLCQRLEVTLVEIPNRLDTLLPHSVYIAGEEIKGERLELLEIGLDAAIVETIELSEKVDPDQPWNAPSEIIQLDDVTVDDWLADRGYSNDVCMSFSDLPPNSQSVLALLSMVSAGGGYSFYTDTERYQFLNGGTELIQSLQTRFAEHIRFGCIVEGVELSDSNVRVIVRGSNGTQNTELYSAVILALPPGTWTGISGLPPFLYTLQPNIVPNRYISAHVVTNEKGYLSALSDDSCRLVWGEYLSNPERDFEAICHILVRGGFLNSDIEPIEAVRTAVKICHLELMDIIGVAEKRWSESPWSKGTYTVFGTGKLQYRLWELVQSRVGRMAFAGDWVYPGWAGFMEGVVRSGQNAALQLSSIL